MDILQQIKKRYPIQLNLTYINARRTFVIQWDECIPTDVRSRIEQEMENLSLSPTERNADLTLRISMEQCPGEESDCLTLRKGEQCWYFARGDIYASLRWALYALVQDLPFVHEIEQAKLMAVYYSASQQALASSLLDTAEYWNTSLTPGVLKPVFEKLVSSHAEELTGKAPAFSSRPVTEKGWELVRDSFSLTARKKQFVLKELAGELFGSSRFDKELDAFCQMLRQTNEFREALDSAAASARKKLCRLPLLDFEARLRDAVAELNENYAEEYSSELKTALNKRAEVRKLSPEQIEQLFRETDELYARQAGNKIKRVFLDELAQRLRTEIIDCIPAVQRTLQRWNRQLVPFCKVRTGREKLDMGWDSCESLCLDRLNTQGGDWDNGMLYTLFTNAGQIERYTRKGWFCSTAVYAACQERGFGFLNIMYPVPGLTDQLVVGFMAQTIQEQNIDG